MLSSTLYGQVKVLNTQDLKGIVPFYWLDHTGFSSDDDVNIDFSPLQEGQVLAPMFPMYQSNYFSKTYIGGKIEKKFLEKLSPTELEKLKIVAQNQKTPEGYNHQLYTYKGDLYAIRSDYNVIEESGFTIGISLDFSMGSKTVSFGDMTTYGFSFDLFPTNRIGKISGINAGDNLQKVVNSWTELSKKDDTKYIFDQARKIAPVLLSSLISSQKILLDQNGNSLAKIQSSPNIAPKEETENSETVPLEIEGLSISDKHTKEWNSVQKDIRKNIDAEIRFKKELKNTVANEKILANKEQNEFIQNICNRLATAYQVGKQIWPRCKIAATLVPNAWAYPGGDIFISAGLLGILSDVDSVTNILGHEIGHVMGRHTSHTQKYNAAYNYSSTFLSLTANYALLGFSLGGGLGYLGPVTWLTWFPQSMASSMAGGIIAGKTLELMFLVPAAALMKYSREHELQADRLGQEAAYQVGMDVTNNIITPPFSNIVG